MTLLPQAEAVVFVSLDPPEDEQVVAHVDWNIVQHQCGHLMNYALRWFLVHDFPSRDLSRR